MKRLVKHLNSTTSSQNEANTDCGRCLRWFSAGFYHFSTQFFFDKKFDSFHLQMDFCFFVLARYSRRSINTKTKDYRPTISTTSPRFSPEFEFEFDTNQIVGCTKN